MYLLRKPYPALEIVTLITKIMYTTTASSPYRYYFQTEMEPAIRNSIPYRSSSAPTAMSKKYNEKALKTKFNNKRLLNIFAAIKAVPTYFLTN